MDCDDDEVKTGWQQHQQQASNTAGCDDDDVVPLTVLMQTPTHTLVTRAYY